MNYQNLYPDATPYQSAPQYTFPPQPSQATDTRPLIPQYPKPRRSMFSKFCILCCGLVCLCLIVVIVIPAVFGGIMIYNSSRYEKECERVREGGTDLHWKTLNFEILVTEVDIIHIKNNIWWSAMEYVTIQRSNRTDQKILVILNIAATKESQLDKLKEYIYPSMGRKAWIEIKSKQNILSSGCPSAFITIDIPSGVVLPKLEVDMSAGDLSIMNSSFINTDINTAWGDVSIEKSEMNETSILAVGTVSILDSVIAGKLDVSSLGDILVGDFNKPVKSKIVNIASASKKYGVKVVSTKDYVMKELTVTQLSGPLHVENVTFNENDTSILNAEGVFSKVDVKIEKAPREIFIENSYIGDVMVSLKPGYRGAFDVQGKEAHVTGFPYINYTEITPEHKVGTISDHPIYYGNNTVVLKSRGIVELVQG